MASCIKNSIIFLHGLSGAGKGELQRKLSGIYTSNGYSPTYVSSGALFRAALSKKPDIASQVRKGSFLDTLGAIKPDIEKAFDQFLRQWVESDGKAVIFLDGLIRRGAFVNKDGIQISSQIEQVSRCLGKVMARLVAENRGLMKYFPEYVGEDKEKFVDAVRTTLKEATHIVADVLPEDAQAQMKGRADKEIATIRDQLQERVTHRQLGKKKMQEIEDCVLRLEAVLHGGIRAENGNLVYTSRLEWNDRIDADLYLPAANEVKKITGELAQSIGLEKSATLVASFEAIGVFTDLRDDDISPGGRQTRIDNYITEVEQEGKPIYEAGFATQALCEDLGFTFLPDGSFGPGTRNRVVITNGQARGISLAQFQIKCEFLASRLYNETESQREGVFEGKEGQRTNKEQ